MQPWQRILISSVSNGVIAFGGAVTAVIVEVGTLQPLSGTTWLMVSIVGIVAMAKDVKSYTTKPPS